LGERESELGELSIWHWLVVLIVVMLLFGSGKMSTLMGDFAKGIKTFRKTMAEEEKPAPPRANERPGALERQDAIATPPIGSENGEKHLAG
jgi:sec-independent protein translocase protein TatA